MKNGSFAPSRRSWHAHTTNAVLMYAYVHSAFRVPRALPGTKVAAFSMVFEYSLSRIFPRMAFNALDIKGYDWIEIDNEEDYKKAMRMFSSQRNP